MCQTNIRLPISEYFLIPYRLCQTNRGLPVSFTSLRFNAYTVTWLSEAAVLTLDSRSERSPVLIAMGWINIICICPEKHHSVADGIHKCLWRRVQNTLPLHHSHSNLKRKSKRFRTILIRFPIVCPAHDCPVIGDRTIGSNPFANGSTEATEEPIYVNVSVPEVELKKTTVLITQLYFPGRSSENAYN